MDEERRRRQQQEHQKLQREFWRAVLAMRNHTIVSCKADYWDDLITGRLAEGSLWEAIIIVGDHLNVAIAEGLLNDRD